MASKDQAIVIHLSENCIGIARVIKTKTSPFIKLNVVLGALQNV